MLVFVTAQQKQNQLEGPRAPGEPGSGDQPNTTLRETLSKHCKNHSQAAKQEQTKLKEPGAPGNRAPGGICVQATNPFAQNK